MALVFAGLAIVLTWPLAPRLFTHVPGTALDDNMLFVWSVWWMRQALDDSGTAFFETRHLFHPFGVNLALHTHAALDALLGATLFGWLPVVAALNAVVLLTCALNGFSVYLLAWRVTMHRFAAALAGVFFAAAPAMAARLYGHFNFYTAWVLAAFAAALLAAIERSTWGWRVAAGALLAAVAYADYYYFVYACVFLGCVLAWRLFAPTLVVAPRWIPQARFDKSLVALALLAGGGALLAWWTGGTVSDFGGVRVSLTSGRNLRAASALLLAWWLWRRRRPRASGALVHARLAGDLKTVAVTCVVAAVMMAPLLFAALEVWRGGHYVSQSYLWRSGPAGADASTLVLGNPFNGIWGAPLRDVHARLGLNAFDGPLWLSVVPIVLVATRRRWASLPAARLWLLVFGVFFVWSLGPFLRAFGADTGVPMPQLLLRFVPVAANARMPAHAATLVCLSAAVLLAVAVSRTPLRWWVQAGLAAVLAVDLWAAPIPLVRADVPPIYQELASRADGAVLELPLGIRDGFGQEGRFDASVLLYQTVHGKPMTGGYVARLSPIVRARFHDSALLDSLLRLSAGETLPPERIADPATVREQLKELGITYVVVDSRATPGALQAYVRTWPLRLVAELGPHALYELVP